MPAVKRIIPAPVKPVAKSRAVAPVRSTEQAYADEVGLPTAMSGDTSNVNEDIWLIYGPKRIGKTSLASQFPGSILLAFEPASRSVMAFRRDCPSWDKFLAVVALLKKKNHKFKIAVIDTGLEAYSMCMEYTCKKYGFEHPGGQNDYGASWDKVKKEFRKPFLELQASGLNIIIICHERLKENETRAGQKFDSVIPAIPGQVDEFFRAIVGNLVYYHMRGKERFIQIRGTDYISAGVGGENHFLTPSGEQVYAIPAGRSYREAYENLLYCFDNKQEETFSDETMKYDEEKIADSIRKHLKKKEQKENRFKR